MRNPSAHSVDEKIESVTSHRISQTPHSNRGNLNTEGRTKLAKKTSKAKRAGLMNQQRYASLRETKAGGRRWIDLDLPSTSSMDLPPSSRRSKGTILLEIPKIRSSLEK